MLGWTALNGVSIRDASRLYLARVDEVPRVEPDAAATPTGSLATSGVARRVGLAAVERLRSLLDRGPTVGAQAIAFMRWLRTPPMTRPSSALDRVPPIGWLAAFALALWPRWAWCAARMADGSDDPLGVVAGALLLAAVARLAPRLRREPSMRWLVLATALAALATLGAAACPALVAALVAALAVAAALRAFVPRQTPMLPLAGLALLALPLVSSLQFYAGFPLRVATAEVSTRLLGAAGFAAERAGGAMVVDGRLVIVDAPCSGVQMVWMAYFCACSAAWLRGTTDRSFVGRLGFVGSIVLVGNVLRNSVLVAVEASGAHAPAGLHDAIGLGVLALVCAAVVEVVRRGATVEHRGTGCGESEHVFSQSASLADAVDAPAHRFAASARARTVIRRIGPRWRAGLVGWLAACAAWPLVAPSSARAPRLQVDASAVEAPREWNGRALRPLALGAVEARFAAQFPGRIERLTDGVAVIVWREVEQATRMLHPAADCYRGLGYRIDEARLERDGDGRLWRCFVAVREGRRVRVCERIVDPSGAAFTDASAWFWAASLGRSHGPWQAITIATPMGVGGVGS